LYFSFTGDVARLVQPVKSLATAVCAGPRL
jgi:hypothetical protein